MRWSWGKKSEDLNLIGQFYVTLKATFKEALVNNTGANKEIADKITILLEESQSWQNAYEIERLLVVIYDNETLKLEVKRRLVDIKSILSEDLYKYYDDLVGELKTEEKSIDKEDNEGNIIEKYRTILSLMLDDLQWKYAIKETGKMYSREVSKKNGCFFIISAFLFALMVFLLEHFNLSDNFYYLTVSILAGAVGASFSMAINSRKRLLNTNLDELKIVRRNIYALTRVLIGMGAAIILFFAMQAEVLTGSLFPSFNSGGCLSLATRNEVFNFIMEDIPDSSLKKEELQKGIDTLTTNLVKLISSEREAAVKDSFAIEIRTILNKITSSENKELKLKVNALSTKLWTLSDNTVCLDLKNLALLIFWAIVVGFSETFVPGLIGKAEKKADIK